MITVETLTSIFGWMTLINSGILVLSTIALITCKDLASNLHNKALGVSREDLNRTYFQFLAYYKLLIIVFNLAPYIGLKIVT